MRNAPFFLTAVFVAASVSVLDMSAAGRLASVGAGLVEPILTVPGELDAMLGHGHVQGASCSENAIYLSYARGVFKLDWDGHVTESCTSRGHLGDIAYADGRIYGVYGLDGVGENESPCFVSVWDEDLNPIAERQYPELLNYRGFGPAVVLDGVLYTSGTLRDDASRTNRWAHPPHRDVTVFGLSTNNLSLLWRHDVEFDYPIHFGVQTFGTDGVNILYGNYGARKEEGNVRNLNFSRTTKDFKLIDSQSFNAAEGFCLVPETVSGRNAPVFFRVVALGGNMQQWTKGVNPPRVRLEFFEYDPITGCMRSITDYSRGSGGRQPVLEERRSGLEGFRSACDSAGQKGRFCVGIATSMEKIRPRDGALPLAARSFSVRLARGEKESVQLFVMPRTDTLKNVSVAVDMGRSGFASSNISVSTLGYVNITNAPPYGAGVDEPSSSAPGYVRKSVKCQLGWWPDPILSHVKRVDVALGDVQGFWIRVSAPSCQKAATYSGHVIVSADDAVPASFPFTVRVNDFNVPQTPELPLAVSFRPAPGPSGWVDNDESRRLIGDPLAPVNIWKRHKDEWRDFITDRYISYDWLSCCNSSYPDFAMLARQARNGLEGRFNLGYWFPPAVLTNESEVVAWRRDVSDRLVKAFRQARAQGLLHRAYLYGCDEAGIENFDRIAFAVDELKRRMPGVPLSTTAFDSTYGMTGALSRIDWFTPQTSAFDSDMAVAARSSGKKVWWYFACDQHAPYANCFIEGQAIEMRSVMGAQAVKYRPDGFLYYENSIWCSSRPVGDSPFTNWDPRGWEWDPRGRRNYHGDGSWTCVGPDGIPLSTIRLENFADGLEDYAYAMALERKIAALERKGDGGDPAARLWLRRARALLAVPREVVDSVRNFSDDPATLYRWRDEMADLIEK